MRGWGTRLAVQYPVWQVTPSLQRVWLARLYFVPSTDIATKVCSFLVKLTVNLTPALLVQRKRMYAALYDRHLSQRELDNYCASAPSLQSVDSLIHCCIPSATHSTSSLIPMQTLPSFLSITKQKRPENEARPYIP